MISKNQIKDGGELSQEMLRSKGENMIKVFEKRYLPLEVLLELRQQLKNRICRKSVMQPCYNCLMIDEVLGVEGEK